MATGSPPPTAVNIDKVDVLKLRNVVKSQPKMSQEQENRIKALYGGVVRFFCKTTKMPPEPRRVAPRTHCSSSQIFRTQMAAVPMTLSDDKVPLFHLKRKSASSWENSSNLTSVYLDVLNEIATSGTTFKDKILSSLVSARASNKCCDPVSIVAFSLTFMCEVQLVLLLLNFEGFLSGLFTYQGGFV